MAKSNDQRRYFRKKALITADFTTEDGSFQGTLKDIGAGGLYIKSKTMPCEGQAISLSFSLFAFDKTIRISGIVSRIGSDGFAVKFYEPIGQLECGATDFPSIVNEAVRCKESAAHEK